MRKALLLGLLLAGCSEPASESTAPASASETPASGVGRSTFEKASDAVFTSTQSVKQPCENLYSAGVLKAFGDAPRLCAKTDTPEAGDLTRAQISNLFQKNQVVPWQSSTGSMYSTIVSIDDNHLMTIWLDEGKIVTQDGGKKE